jgi:hypothetical protein
MRRDIVVIEIRWMNSDLHARAIVLDERAEREREREARA